MSHTWVEAALNGPWGKGREPPIPITVADIIRDGVDCARAGASIIHVHAYDPTTGRQNDDAATYAAIIEGIREQEDVIVYPTIPFLQGPEGFLPNSAASRFRAIEDLAARGLLELAVVDPGSINLITLDEIPSGSPGSIYMNPGSHIFHGLRLAAKHKFVPSFAIYEPGFARLGHAMHAAFDSCPTPIYRFMFSDQFSFGFPCEEAFLDAYISLMHRLGANAHLMVGGLGVDILPLIPHAVANNLHLRVGLEDAPEGSGRSNTEWVSEAVNLIQRAGKEPASSSMVRRHLKLEP